MPVWKRILILVVVFGSLAAGLIYANVQVRASGDRGLDVATLPSGARCENVRWAAEDLPVTLALDPSIPVEQRVEFAAVVQDFNATLDEQVFVVVLAPYNYTPVDRFVRVETTNDVRHGRASLTARPVSCTFIRGTIQLPGLLADPEKRRAAFRHELGHAVGLAHDLVEESIMWPRIEQWSPNSALTAHDRALLRRRWAIDRGQ